MSVIWWNFYSYKRCVMSNHITGELMGEIISWSSFSYSYEKRRLKTRDGILQGAGSSVLQSRCVVWHAEQSTENFLSDFTRTDLSYCGWFSETSTSHPVFNKLSNMFLDPRHVAERRMLFIRIHFLLSLITHTVSCSTGDPSCQWPSNCTSPLSKGERGGQQW